MDLHPRAVFREPDGPQTGLVFSVLSLVSLLGWVYFGVVLDGSHTLLVFALAFAAVGVAESLPTDRRRAAGVLRIVAIALLLGFLVVLVSDPWFALDVASGSPGIR